MGVIYFFVDHYFYCTDHSSLKYSGHSSDDFTLRNIFHYRSLMIFPVESSQSLITGKKKRTFLRSNKHKSNDNFVLFFICTLLLVAHSLSLKITWKKQNVAKKMEKRDSICITYTRHVHLRGRNSTYEILQYVGDVRIKNTRLSKKSGIYTLKRCVSPPPVRCLREKQRISLRGDTRALFVD